MNLSKGQPRIKGSIRGHCFIQQYILPRISWIYSMLISKLYLLTCIYSLIFSHAVVFIRLFFLMLSHLLMHLNLLMHLYLLKHLYILMHLYLLTSISSLVFIYLYALTRVHFLGCIHWLRCSPSSLGAWGVVPTAVTWAPRCLGPHWASLSGYGQRLSPGPLLKTSLLGLKWWTS